MNPADPDPPVPPEVVPSEDLTCRAQDTSGNGPFPFDDAQEFDRVFDGLARILHRSKGHHVLLVGERGVGKNIVVIEFARRVAAGQPAFLADKRVISIDCRYVCAEESRRALFAVLNQIAGHPELVVAIEGFGSLLRAEHGASNKGLLFSGLSRVQCRIVGLMTPHEYGELVGDDPDYQDFFGKVEVDEPSPDTAVRLMRHFARGLEAKFGLTIDDEAIREAVGLSATYILNDQLPAKALRILHDLCEDVCRKHGLRAPLLVSPESIPKASAGQTLRSKRQ